MGFGLGVLRLPPDAFWGMTPRELAAAIDPHGGAHGTMNAADFAALRARFPDEGTR